MVSYGSRGACPQEETPVEVENHLPGEENGSAALERPETKTDTISIEGMEEAFLYPL